MGDLYYVQLPFDDADLYKSGDYHLIVRLKRKYNRFHTLCKFGNIDIIKLLISHGADDWNNGLIGACGGGHLELAELMISHGAYVWNFGLIEACKNGHLETANLMIASSADNWTFGLSYACSNGHLELVKLMTSYGATWCLVCGKSASMHK
jgi:ankyrin repeat protein